MKFVGFQHMTFWQKTFRQRHFIKKAFRHKEILAKVHFGMGIFWQRNVWALGHFGIRIFWHMDFSAQIHFGTMQSNINFSIDISALVSLCQNVHMPKCPYTKNDLKSYNYLKNKVLRAHAARHTPSCLWHFPKHLKSFDGCQQSHGPDIFVPNGLSHNPTFLWLPLCAIARLSALMPTNCGAKKCSFFGFRYRP